MGVAVGALLVLALGVLLLSAGRGADPLATPSRDLPEIGAQFLGNALKDLLRAPS